VKTSTPTIRLFATALLLVSVSSCYKILPYLPPGIPPVVTIQHPLETLLDSLEQAQASMQISATGVPYVSNGPDTGLSQAEIAFAIRTSVPGVVTQLGTYLPDGPYTHTVTLWDSVTGAVLAQVNVVTPSGGGWAFADLDLNQYFPVLQPNHGYIVGFNSLAIGSSLNSNDPGDAVYHIQGIYFEQNDMLETANIIPFTEGSITYEGWYLDSYNAVLSAPIFPGGPGSYAQSSLAWFGACDIGFIAQP
jgi:hypothetical protein